MSGSKGTDIDNVKPTVSVYTGATPEGRIKFFGRDDDSTIGFDVFRSHTQDYASIGPAATLALGLTECCAALGRGKVYYYIKDFYDKSTLTRGAYPDEYIQIPEIYFTDFKWTAEERTEWFQLPHSHRLDLLSARGHALHPHTVTMPLTVCFEKDDYETIQFYDGVATAVLYYNTFGTMYMGFFADLSQHAFVHNVGGNTRPAFVARKEQIAGFKMFNGAQVAQRLTDMYREARPESMFFYEAIIRKSIEAHRLWVANGGYTIKSDPNLGETVADAVARVRGTQIVEGRDLGVRLQQMWDETSTWSEPAKKALEDFLVVVEEGGLATAWFTMDDANWKALPEAQLRKIVDICALEQEARERNIDTPRCASPIGPEPSTPAQGL